MSSLFKNSFQSKQLKQFTEITLKAIPSIKRDAIKPIYKTIKSGNDQDFDCIESAIHGLQRKFKLDLRIASYSRILNDKQNNTFSEVQSAKSHVVQLTTNEDTSQLIQQIERAFNLQKGSLSHPQSNNTHLIPSKSKRRSLSVTKNNGLGDIDAITAASATAAPTPTATANATATDTDTPTIHHIRANTVNRVSLKALSESPKDPNPKETIKEKQRSRSVMNLNTNLRARRSESDKNRVPGMNTKEYLQFLLEKAVTHKSWNDNDADRLCKCAISMKCDWITVHSMWVKRCCDLLKQYTIKQYKSHLKAHKKSKRRGSRRITVPPKGFKKVKNENELKSSCKICVTIGYPLGQTSTVSKVAETRQSVADGAQRVRLMVSAGKVTTEDWGYILHEVKSVVSAANGCDVRIVFPDTNQITEDIKHEFNQIIMQGMAAKTPTQMETNIANKARDMKQKKLLRCTFSDESSDEDDAGDLPRSKSVQSSSPSVTRKSKSHRNGKQKRYTKKEDSDTSDDESSASFCSSFGDCTTPTANPKIIHLSKSEGQVGMGVDHKISKRLLNASPKKKRGKKRNAKNERRASTMTSLKSKGSKDKKRGNNHNNNNNKKKRNTLMINQSTTDALDIEPGAVTERKPKPKQKHIKKKKRKKNVGNVRSVGTIEELKKGKKKKKKKKKEKKENHKATVNSKSGHKRKKKENERGKNNNNKGQKHKKQKENKTTNKKNTKKKGKKADKRRAKSVGKLKTKSVI